MVLSAASDAALGAPPAAMESHPTGSDAVVQARDVVFCVKPVMISMIHTDVWEGPCRWKGIPPAEEIANAEKSFAQLTKQIAGWDFRGVPGVKFLEPAHLTFCEDFVIKPQEWAKLAADSQLADAYLVDPFTGMAGFQVAERFQKPLVFRGVSTRWAHIASYARSKGLECFVSTDDFRSANDIEGFKKLLTILRARKVFAQTTVLNISNRGLPGECGLGVWNAPDLEKRLGVAVKTVSYKVLADEMEQVLASKSATETAEQAADDLLRKADRSYIDRKYVVRSFQFYQTVQNLMAKYGCNSFTIDCFDFCAARLPEKWTITPCLIHTLLKDREVASACESDLSALLAMRMLMSVSNKSSHMGNCDRSQRIAGAFRVNHSVPGLKMNGFDQPDLPYQLGRFTNSGWGTKAIVDFAKNQEKAVTVARVNPSATKVLVLKGQLAGATGWSEDIIGCSVHADIKPPEGKFHEFERKRADYGGHMQWVFGDYSNEMQELGEMLKLEVDLVG
jgi:hypothetical protein